MLKNNYETIDDLGRGGLRIIQDKRGFSFSIDAVLLTDFVCVPKNAHLLDMCTGSGIIPILLSHKSQAEKLYGIEILPEVAEMAERSIQLNQLSQKISIHCGDATKTSYESRSFDIITCNPPYMNAGGGLQNPNSLKNIARHEILLTLDQVIKEASRLLKPGGKLCMVHKPHRLCDIITSMKNYRIEPKRMQLVYPKINKPPNILLIEGALFGNPMLKILEPKICYPE